MVIPDTTKHCTGTNYLYRKLDYLAGSTTNSLHLAMAESLARKLELQSRFYVNHVL